MWTLIFFSTIDVMFNRKNTVEKKTKLRKKLINIEYSNKNGIKHETKRKRYKNDGLNKNKRRDK